MVVWVLTLLPTPTIQIALLSYFRADHLTCKAKKQDLCWLMFLALFIVEQHSLSHVWSLNMNALQFEKQKECILDEVFLKISEVS